jgi:hypothetical protein
MKLGVRRTALEGKSMTPAITLVLAVGALSAGDPPRPFGGLTDAEIYQIDSEGKDYAIDLFAAGVWTKESDEYRQFRRYGPKAEVRIATYDTERRQFTDNYTVISGAEYRRALAQARSVASYPKLDKEGQARINLAIYGQRTIPERGSEAHNRGRERIARLAGVVAGERHARPADPTDKK